MEAKVYAIDWIAEVPLKALAGIDALIHCALRFSGTETSARQAINVQGSVRLLKAACEMGIGKVIFVSSWPHTKVANHNMGPPNRRSNARFPIPDHRGAAWNDYGKDAGGLLRCIATGRSA
jgi:nucleoside-diphosphate-sugar epimerase